MRAAALRQLETRRREGAATALEEAWLALDRGDLDGCQRLCDALKRRHLDVSARPKLDRLVDELRSRRHAAARFARIDERVRAVRQGHRALSLHRDRPSGVFGRLDLPIEGAWDGDRIAAVVARAAEWLTRW